MFAFLISLLSIVGNVLTIYILRSQTKYSQQIRIYQIQLAISHIVAPVAGYWMLIASSLKGTWLFGEIGCKFYGFLQGFCAFFSILVVAAIAINRATRLKAISTSNSTETIRNSIILWIFTFALIAPPLFGLNRFVIEGLGTTCSIDLHPVDVAARAYIIFILFFGFIFPLFIIFFSYRRVCLVLFESALFRQQTKVHGRLESSGEIDLINSQLDLMRALLRR
uniref:G-protein coupled receptors family 1 profile domain-containing protein n=1 Tax=Plectus sambesii TaxID=2011161 RepID=A0A914WRC5_9BILA